MDFRHFAWAKSCNFLRDDLTHLGDSFKLLITKIGDRPVGPYLCASRLKSVRQNELGDILNTFDFKMLQIYRL